MEENEAHKVLQLMATADGGCVYCARELFLRFTDEFPKWADLARVTFEEIFEEPLASERGIRP